MRIHTDKLNYGHFLDALSAEMTAGRVAPSVRFKTLTAHKSQSHARAFEIQLEALDRVKGDGRRAGNSGSYGAMVPDYDGYAATYDEWGWLIAHLYSIDPDAVWGSVKRPTYAGRDDFDHRTGLTYNPALLLADLEGVPSFAVTGDPYPYQHKAQVGRYGYGRKSEDDYYPGWDKYAPRTAEWVRAFAHLTMTGV